MENLEGGEEEEELRNGNEEGGGMLTSIQPGFMHWISRINMEMRV